MKAKSSPWGAQNRGQGHCPKSTYISRLLERDLRISPVM